MAGLPLTERIRRRVRRSLLAPLEARVGGAVRRRLHAGRSFRPVFVTGAMGSGTTLLALSLAQRCELGSVITESAHQVAPDSFLHNAGVEAYASVAAYERAILPSPGWSVEQGRDDLLAMYRSYASGPSDFALDKGPNTNLVRAGFLARCFPEARFVVVFRDPVATIEGFRRKWPTFASDSLQASIDFYAHVHDHFLEEMAALGERAILLEYEVLIDHYDAMLAALAQRLGLEPARGTRSLPTRGNYQGRGIRNVHGSRIGVVADANAGAYQNLDRGEIEQIQAGLGGLHDRLCAATNLGLGS